MTVKVKIDGKQIEAQESQSILEAAREHGFEIPTLCYHKDLSPVGSCRLCSVEIEGYNTPVMSCVTPVADGMVIKTQSPALKAARKLVLELLLQNYVDAGYTAEDRDETEFMHWVQLYEAQLPEGFTPPARYEVNADPNPFVWVDFNKCIMCTRCVRACAEVQGRFVWGVGERGHDARIIAGADTTMLEARCESCGACVAYCPTGALDDKLSIETGKADELVTTTCTYCGVGCRFDLNVKDGKIVRVSANPEAPVNGMALCVKGRYGYDFVHHQDRLTQPMVREYLLGKGKRTKGDRGKWVPVEWDTALDLVADRLAAIKNESGGDAVGILSSAKCTNEENYLAQKFARQVIGTHNIDHCARL